MGYKECNAEEMREEGVPVYSLFSSGKAYVISLDIVDVRSNDATIPVEWAQGNAGEYHETTINTAKNSVKAYFSKKFPGVLTKMKGSGIVLNIAGGEYADNLKSAGLALAIEIAQAIALKCFGKIKCPFPAIAATGIVEYAGSSKPVKRVGNFEEKVRAVIRDLPRGSLFLFPKDNEEEITGDLEDVLKEKEIVLCPVSDVYEALDKVLDAECRSFRSRYTRKYLARFAKVAVILFVIGAVAIFAHNTLKSPHKEASKKGRVSNGILEQEISEEVIKAISEKYMKGEKKPIDSELSLEYLELNCKSDHKQCVGKLKMSGSFKVGEITCPVNITVVSDIQDSSEFPNALINKSVQFLIADIEVCLGV